MKQVPSVLNKNTLQDTSWLGCLQENTTSIRDNSIQLDIRDIMNQVLDIPNENMDIILNQIIN